MDPLHDKVAVVTGGASGIGSALAYRLGSAGMRIAIADIEESALEQTVSHLRDSNIEVVGVPCDVSSHQSFEDFGETVRKLFGTPHLICLNAGVGTGGSLVDQSLESWKWVLGVNLFGIIHGLHVFLPSLLEQNEGHIVITASIAGLTSFGGLGPYNASKHAAVSIAETLYAELAESNPKIGVSCLCPGFVATNIFTAERNRPEFLADPSKSSDDEATQLAREELLNWLAANALRPEMVAEAVYDAIASKEFWIFTDENYLPEIIERHSRIAENKNPSSKQIFDHLFE